ncbi:MAG TPA: ComF family protein [Gammaproteobacteria bacterium]|nr:ComF family protein [Gammaproteobacteria bacterium]
MSHDWFAACRALLYPPHCLVCGATADERALCAACAAELPWNETACARCARPLPVAAALCGPCLRRPPSFDAAWAALRYDFPLDRLLAALKFHGRLAHARILGGWLAERLALRRAVRPDALVPVPLHPARLRERGYNQALELARSVARRLDLVLAPDLCRRVRATDEQARLPAVARRRNVRGAFAVTAPPPRHVALLDDVMTTGSTVEELARVLRRAGAARIEVWCVARAG